MCWIGKCDVKIAKRDFYVYKLGYVSYKGFHSLYQNFIYTPKEINKEVKLNPNIFEYTVFKLKEEQLCSIYEGYHSYKDISLPYSGIGSYSRIIYLGKYQENIRLSKSYYIATFIVPKGSEYYENINGEIVSSSIIYTGKYVKIGNSKE